MVTNGPLFGAEPPEDIALQPASVICSPWKQHVAPTNRQGVQAANGTIYIVYDHQRTPAGEILMATFREEDVRAGKPVSGKTRFQVCIDRLPAP